ncbi:hypothetical protein ACWD4L_04685 [Streptomyces sp. NPDC002596]|nr:MULTISPECIES: hypothetical protein [unclassified Streptomyces]MCX4535049.1 hypothetical protein [Streptomyces sp. NBC_01669]WRZ99635.1 hypothetical protein OHA79_18355 [Streptomyces sp. NBC_00841]
MASGEPTQQARQQVKKVRGSLAFAPPKRGKLRDVPLDPEVSAALTEQ